MSTSNESVDDLTNKEYKWGFVTDIDSDSLPPGLDEDVIRLISAKKNEPPFLLEWRLRAFRQWQTMQEPTWPNVRYEPIDYQKISYFSAPRSDKDRPKSLEEVDPELLETYEKLGIPLKEQEQLAGVAVDAVFDSVSVATTFKRQARRRWASSSARSPRRCASIPSWCASTSGRWCRLHRQLLRRVELRGLHRRLVRLHARRACVARWSCRRTSASTPPTRASSSGR